MLNQYSRTELLFGKDAMERLWRSRVAVFGIGGVGGYTVEALVRSGIGTVDLIDDNRICLTNINRQLYATRKTVGKYKVDVAAERIAEINPQVAVNLHKTFFGPETAAEFDFSDYDYVVDAIDTVTGKIALVMQAQASGTPIISSMGAGNKVDPTAFQVADIYETKVCPLARVMRRELKKRGVKALKVVYSREEPLEPIDVMAISCRAHCICPPGTARKCTQRWQVPGSNAFVPSVVGLIIAGEVIPENRLGVQLFFLKCLRKKDSIRRLSIQNRQQRTDEMKCYCLITGSFILVSGHLFHGRHSFNLFSTSLISRFSRILLKMLNNPVADASSAIN